MITWKSPSIGYVGTLIHVYVIESADGFSLEIATIGSTLPGGLFATLDAAYAGAESACRRLIRVQLREVSGADHRATLLTERDALAAAFAVALRDIGGMLLIGKADLATAPGVHREDAGDDWEYTIVLENDE